MRFNLVKSDPIPVSCPYTVRVAGPVKPIPNDASFLPFVFGRSSSVQPTNRFYKIEVQKLKDAAAQRELVNQIATHQLLHPSTRAVLPWSLSKGL